MDQIIPEQDPITELTHIQNLSYFLFFSFKEDCSPQRGDDITRSWRKHLQRELQPRTTSALPLLHCAEACDTDDATAELFKPFE